ncbi:MAG: hypothetical protein HOC70_08500 [Gammaproteobacteria bacterium]|nr:hypothetical protein [Gammaproteobacteria bacterium]
MSMNETGREVDMQVINGRADTDSEVEFATELAAFAEAVASQDEAKLDSARQVLRDTAGSAVLVDAAGVAGNFQRMVRIADSMGIPVDSMDNEISNHVREELDLYRFRSAENSMRSV